MSSDELLTVQEVAVYLRVPVRWVYERTRQRTIPVRKLGGFIRIPKRELEAWVERDGQPEAMAR